jgi:hypothetical protein
LGPAPPEWLQAFLYAFVLLELDGTDMRREPIEVRKATLASILRKSRTGVRLNEHLEHPEGEVVFRHACKMGLEGDRVQTARLALQVGPLAGLAQVQEPAGTGSEAGGRRGLEPLIRGPAVSTANPNVANRRQQPARAYTVWIPLPAPETPSTSPVPNSAVVSPPDDRPATTTLEVAIKIPAPTTAALPAGATAAPTTHCRPAAASTTAPYPRAATAGAASTSATGARPAIATTAATSSATAHAEALREGRREHHEGRRDGSDNRNFREHVFLSGKKNNGLVART